MALSISSSIVLIAAQSLRFGDITNYYNQFRLERRMMTILMRIKMLLAKLLKTRYYSCKSLPDEPSTSVRAEISYSVRERFDETSPGLSEPSTRRW